MGKFGWETSLNVGTGPPFPCDNTNIRTLTLGQNNTRLDNR